MTWVLKAGDNYWCTPTDMQICGYWWPDQSLAMRFDTREGALRQFGFLGHPKRRIVKLVPKSPVNEVGDRDG